MWRTLLCTRSIMMERQQSGQQEKLVQVHVDTEPSTQGRPGDPAARQARLRARLRCLLNAVAAAMGFVVGAVAAGLILHYFMFTLHCSQDAAPFDGGAKINMAASLQRRDQQGRYEVFTVSKAATYLIYGWVTLSDAAADEEVALIHTHNGAERDIDRKRVERVERAGAAQVFFLRRAQLANNSTISVRLGSAYNDSRFYLDEL